MVDITLTDEQRLLRETLERYLAREHAMEDRTALAGAAHTDERWAGFVEIGLPAVPVAADDGGIGGGGTEIAIVAEQLGRNLVATPYLETAVMAASVIEACVATELRRSLAEDIVSGRVFTVAHFEADSRFDAGHVRTSARREGTGFVLDGAKASIAWGDRADCLLVSALLDGDLAVFAVDPKGAGVEVKGYVTNDGQRGADLNLANVELDGGAMVVAPDQGRAAIDTAICRARIYLSCEAAAIMRHMCDLTRDYVGTRQQFGTSIGNFQVIQHRLVDMYSQTEQSLSMALLAADAWNAPAVERDRVTSAARALVARAGRFVGQNAVQLHGGIGMAWETPLSHYFKRLTMNGMQMGDESYHLRRFAALVRTEESTH
ncbi:MULTISPECIES: acyl-CoA dehydrogenase family protein [unclassified Chelatococcus]|jgi:alkylation response protein AidB-like acyl-CoA dehydrogenase|uniref:acyl-CoA dehydrogenase family protein n=1 Tax=unclassified Chelatococcus TaxID=2638111 RepID=UPI001BCE92D1|nr:MULTISPECIES: acyl-CoA dehydrogenase family protein [unclassified Chelatococcus]CAH1655696.1 Acyl-CoA dehydrogenase family protein [Hyphomicrobiales bacterium]MBS7742571.1 acyl-CoA dehydrogenase family protein [Chelatococcus sp. HY11]MBX3542311.1 acyl-CoA dehydrogenase family protein [Chelatococcus sp.]MCO5075471.1 acyl-CoA dehydrogenase family protein [Chelatococcus sp.]CAH1695605.1 Acyl-CoA dehydrogenase family protein [Hyphomicrobiales bacterium]